MNTFRILLFACVILASCQNTDKSKVDQLIESTDLHIQLNTYGGYLGYSEQNYQIIKTGEHALLIIDKDADPQYSWITDKGELLSTFIKEVYKTDIPNREMSNSCLSGIDSEYIIKSGFTSLTLKPDNKCDSLFRQIINH